MTKKKAEDYIREYPGATDIHFTEEEPVVIRKNGELIPLQEIAGIGLMRALFDTYIPAEKEEALLKGGSCDAALTVDDLRCRLHCYRAQGKLCAAVRVLPSLDRVAADPDMAWMEKISSFASGLVIICGPTGSGKSTTMARLIETIGAKRACHIVTLEDPAEYLYSPGKALIHQREIARDISSFAEGIRAALREDPDVIAVGEMRDTATMAAALTAAETGHLVLATLHTGFAAEAVRRVIGGFPESERALVRSVLASVLKSVSAQRLFRKGDQTILLREILVNVPAVAHLIREGKEEQISSYMEAASGGMRTFRQAVYGVKNISPALTRELLDYVQ